MRKFILLLLLSVILSMVGCGDSINQEENEDKKATLLKNLELNAVEGMSKDDVIEFLGVGYEEFNIDGSEYIFWTDRGISGVYEVGIEANEVIYGVWIEGEEGTERLASFKSNANDTIAQADQDDQPDAQEQTEQQPVDDETDESESIDQISEEEKATEEEYVTLGITIEDWVKNIEVGIQKMEEVFDGVTDYTPETLLDDGWTIDLINDYTIVKFFINEDGTISEILILQSGDGSDEAVFRLVEGQILAVLSVKPDYEIEDCSEILNNELFLQGDVYIKDGITYEMQKNFEIAGEVYPYATRIYPEIDN